MESSYDELHPIILGYAAQIPSDWFTPIPLRLLSNG
jgi:hypothetical protein